MSNEREALARLRQGDIAGLEALVRLYQVRAVRVAYLVLRDRALAEDVAQGAFLRVYERIAQLDPARPFAPWFFRIVVNDALKAAARWERQVPLDAVMGDADAPPMQFIAPDQAVDDLLAHAETTAAIWVALGGLSPEQRTAIVLRYYLDLSEAEMSARLHVPPGTVKSRLHNARHRLRGLLPAWLGPKGDLL